MPITIEPPVVLASEEGFVLNDSSVSAKITNDAAWTTLKTTYVNSPLTLLVDGEIHTDNGIHWLDRVLPVKIYGTVINAGFTCVTDSTIAFRIRGIIGGKYCNFVGLYDLIFKGGWSDNSFTQGTKPNTGTGEATWVWASPCELLYVDGFEIISCTSDNSQYDGFSLPRNIRSGKIIDCTASNCFDDGFNPGGDIGSELGTSDDVLNIHIEGCLAEYIYNSGFHLSGGARNITGINNIANRCGGFALDYVHDNIHWTNFLATNIGQASASDPDFGDYPGTASNVDGFYRTSVAANVIGAMSSYTKSNIHIQVVAKNVFDRTNREQRALSATNSSSPLQKDCFFDIDFDNTSQNSTYYNSASIKPVYSGGANNTLFTDTHMDITAKFASTNVGGRSDVHHAGNTNTTSLHLEYARAANKVNAQLFGDDAVIERLTNIGGGYPFYSGKRIYTKKAVSTNGNPNAATACKGIGVTDSDCIIDNLVLEDCHLLLGANGDRLRVKNLFYRGTKDQTPSIIANAYGGDDLIINHLYCEQATLETGVSTGIMIHNRKPGMKIVSLTGYSLQTGTSFISLDNADTNGFSILGGDFKTAQIFINEIVAGGDLNLGGLFLTSSLASGSEIRIKSDNSRISGLSVRRENANSSAVITLSGDNCTVLASGTNLGVGGLLTDTGIGNQTSLLET